MPELNLTLPGRFDTEDAEAVRAALSKHLQVGRPLFLLQRSAGPPPVSIIQLIGDAAAWLPMTVPATVYLSTLAKRAGDATWDGIASVLKRKEVKPLADVAAALAAAADKAGGEAGIIIGLDIPDDHFGTVVIIRDRNPAAVARKLAAFVVHVEELSRVMRAEVEAGRPPLGQATVEVQDDGSLLVTWCSQHDLERHEKRVGRGE